MTSNPLTLVLLPGMDGTGRLFRWLVPAIESAARVQVVSYPPERILDMGGLADLVIRLLPEGPHVILAESFSGPIAALVAARQPPGLQGLIFSASFVSPPASGWLKPLAFSFWFRLPCPRIALRQLLLEGTSTAEVIDEVAQALRAVAPEVLAARLQESLTVDARDALHSCRLPVAALAASRDRLLGERGVETIRDARPDATIITLEGPHLLLQARPIAAAELIRWQFDGWLGTRSA